MSTINRLSWLLLAVVGVSFGMALAIVGGAAVLLHASLSLPAIWAAAALVVVFKMATEGSSERSVPPPSKPSKPPMPPEPEPSLEELEALHRMWRRGDISEATYRRAVERATRRYSPPPPPAPPRRRRW